MRSAPTQYFVNCQLYEHLLNHRSELADWSFIRENAYSNESRHTVDLKISHTSNFNIWIESDNARSDQLYKKLWEKLPIILNHGNPASDFYVPFIYSTNSNKSNEINFIVKDLLKTIENNIRIHSIFTSFAVLHIDTESKESPFEREISIDNSFEPTLVKIAINSSSLGSQT